MRTVFTNSMCAHVWAQLSQPFGRSGSMKFDGAVAFSYATPIANIITPQGRAPVALFLPNSWGVTTARHFSHYRSAARHLPQFEVPDIFSGYETRLIRDAAPNPDLHKRNLDALRDNYETERARLLRVPCDSWRVSEDMEGSPLYATRAHRALGELADVLARYADAFGIPCEPLPWSADADKAIARRDRIANDPKREAKRAKGAEQREKAKAKAREKAIEARRVAALEARERVALWMSGADVRLNYGDVPRELGALLRVRGDVVETSQGAEAPVSHVRPALAFYLRTVRDGLTYQRDPALATVRLGHFRLDEIDAQGNVRAGCHYITAASVSELVTALQATTSSDAP